MEKDWEYIVVGSGAGGGPVAANLARAGHKVLLLEAGGCPESVNMQVPAFHPAASEEPGMSWQFFVRHYENEEQQRRDSKYVADKKGIFYPRAGTLGGCTAHNAMIFGYPSNADWDRIAETTGDPSWGSEPMRRIFQRMEGCRYRTIQRILQWLLRWNPSRHGFAGWLMTDEADPELLEEDKELATLVKKSILSTFTAFSGSLKDRLVGAFLTLLDPNDWRFVKAQGQGLRLAPLNTHQGRRFGTRDLILATQKQFPDQLTVRLGALATRILFEGERAVGVEYLEGEHLYRADPLHDPAKPGVQRQAGATREIILAGGAFNTPQLLQLSGIGPAALLKERGIEVKLDLPGVGANLQDRYEVGIVLRMKKPFKLLAGSTMRPPEPGEPLDPQFREWLQGKGVYASNGAVISIIKKSDESRPIPDLFIFGLVTDFRGYYPNYSEKVRNARQEFTWAILKAHTNNTAGRVAIRSSDPLEPPDVDFHYFDEGNDTTGEDLESVLHAVEFVRAFTAGYGHLIEAELYPGDAIRDREQIKQWIKDVAWGHHASCTCKMGPATDPLAVLDSKLRVHGTKGLRVVDASVFPRIPGLFIVSSIYMVAEKASDMILAAAQG